MKKIILLTTSLSIFFSICYSNTFVSVATGNWNNTGTWVDVEGDDSDGLPDADDDLILGDNITVTCTSSVVCNSIIFDFTIYSSGNEARLDISVGGTVTVVGSVTVNDEDGTPATEIGHILLSDNSAVLDINGDLIFSATAVGKAKITYSRNATLRLAGSITNTNGNIILGPLGQSGSFIFDGAVSQNIVIDGTNFKYPNLFINNSAASPTAVTLGGAITSANVVKSITIQDGILTTGANTITGGSGDSFIINSGGELNISSASSGFPTGFSTFTLDAGSTVAYSDGAQNISDQDYSNITLSGTGAKTLPAASTVTVAGTLTINGTATLDLNTNAEDISIWSLDDNHTTDGITESATNTITFTGSTAATIDVAGSADYGDVIFSNTAGTRINSVSGSLLFNDVTISGTGILDPDAIDFSIDGDWTNNNGVGGFTPGTGQLITFTGDANRIIGGTGSTNFQDLTCNLGTTAGRTLTFSTACQVFGVLDVTDGQIVAGGMLTLNSDGSGTAAIADLSNGSPEATPISGDVIAERYINEGGPEYYMLASPLTDADFEDWNQEFYMTGFTGTNDASNSFKSVVTRNEVAGTWTNPSNTTDIISNGTGYMAYIGNDGIGTALPKTLNITGTVKTGGLTLFR